MNNKEDAYDRIKRLFEEKKNNHGADEEEKIRLLEAFFKKKQGFFQIDAKTAFKILRYLGIPEDELMPVYKELISPANYMKRVPRVRAIIPPDMLKGDNNVSSKR